MLKPSVIGPRNPRNALSDIKCYILLLTDITTLARTSSLSERKTEKEDSSTVVIVAASLGTVLFVAVIALAALVLLKRRRRHSSEGINDFLIKHHLLKGHDVCMISLCRVFHRKMSTCCVICPVTILEVNFNDFFLKIAITPLLP